MYLIITLINLIIKYLFYIIKHVIILIGDSVFSYIKGIVTDIESNYVTIENNGIGYLIYVANPYSFNLDEETIIYLYSHVREDEYSLYGFKTIDEKSLFLKLINVKGIGPKMALPIIATGSINGIYDAIERENILYLTKFPKIGEKVARQIILDLKGKLSKTLTKSTADTEELVKVLENLGYKFNDIKKVIPNIDTNLKIEDQVKEALKLFLK